jgi:hypothetical protein
MRRSGSIQSVIGLIGDDLHLDALITLRCATISLPVAAADRQRLLAVSVLFCERVLAELDGRREDKLSPDSERVLGAVPTRRNKLAAHPPYQALASSVEIR